MTNSSAKIPAEYYERMKRCRGDRPVPKRLAPLAPNAFLYWAWSQWPKGKWSSALTVDDVWWELAHGCDAVTFEEVRKSYVRIAARVRRNQRLGLEPFHGIA